MVFIRVIKTKALVNLQHDISGTYNRNQVDPQEVKSNSTFRPHITIAYRDIPAATFPEIWKEYKNRKFKRSFIVTHFTLLKHDGQKWQPFKEFQLSKQEELSLF